MVAVAETQIEVRNAISELWNCEAEEVLVEGPARTGKSFGLVALVVERLMNYPESRLLLARKTRVSMTQSILVTWEKVLDLYGLHSVHSGARRDNRSSYVFPNESEVAIYGFDDPERVKSSEYDWILVNEGTELNLEDWEIALSRLSNGKAPFQQAIIDCNPGAPNHWLNRRPTQQRLDERGDPVFDERGNPVPQMVRFVTRHKDNPYLWDRGTQDWTRSGRAYMAKLHNLTGSRRSRLLLGLWSSTEGAVFEDTWDVAKHCIGSDRVPKELRGYVAGVDWGYRHPGVNQVWGCDGDGRMYRVREIYRSGQTIDWWERQAKFLYRDYPGIRAFVCDPSQPAHIEQFVTAGLPARGADRSVLKRQDMLMPNPLKGSLEVGLQILEERLRGDKTGPRIFYIKDSTGWYDDDGNWIVGRDEELAERGWPTCTEDEFSLYAFPKGEDGKPLKEKPVALYDDGIDASRYVAMHLENNEVGGQVALPLEHPSMRRFKKRPRY